MSGERPTWLPPRLASRTGAAHLRRAIPCQDACGWRAFHDSSGAIVQVLAVSDGHGSKRHWRSDVGSRLAVEVALREVERTLPLKGWDEWLATELPDRISQEWLQATGSHWRNHPVEWESRFSPAPYGATLGLLVLTPHWWGHTGLGDWDLVRIAAEGAAELLSEEPPGEGGSEATFSLCTVGCERQFPPRSGVHPLLPGTPPFQLLLSTDGVRKACGSDGDFLHLARHLADLPPSPQAGEEGELEATLDHVSAEGSGDDVSVVICSWGVGGTVLPPCGPLVLQPPPPPAPVAEGSGSGQASPSPTTWKAPAVEPGGQPEGGRLLAALAGLALLSLAGVFLARWLRLGPFAIPPSPSVNAFTITPEQRQAIRWQVEQLCRSTGTPAMGASLQAERIRATLQQRRSTFEALATGDPQLVLQELRRDPLSALIALNRLDASQQERAAPLCGALQRELAAQWALVERERKRTP